jgi:hypothetical protein
MVHVEFKWKFECEIGACFFIRLWGELNVFKRNYSFVFLIFFKPLRFGSFYYKFSKD